MALLLSKFDPAKLFYIEQANERSIELLKEWLPRHKFKDWKTTEDTKKRVTNKMKQERAAEIAEILGNPQRWHSHGRGISIQYLESDEIKLKIDNFSENPELNNLIRSYYNLTVDYMGKLGKPFVIHSPKGVRRLHV